MDHSYPYIASLTREPFLFYEMRSTAKLMSEGFSDDAIVKEIVEQNLFQYPTERMIKNIAQVCLNRFKEADSKELIELVAKGSSDTAKQACLFLMMNYYRLVWEFMINVVGEKYRTKNNSFGKVDLNSFFTQLQEQNETVASWSDSTVNKCKQVLKKSLVEAGYLDNARSQELNHILLDPELKDIIEHTQNQNALIAFGCM